MSKIYELIIIGSGPAGLTAGIYASRAQIDSIIIEQNGMSGGQIINTYEVENYPGIPSVTGYELAMKFRDHCEQLEVVFVDGQVVQFQVEENIKKVVLDNGEEYCAKAVIIATGAVNRKLGVPGEEELAGCGVSYCATCDGAFFKNRTTVVVGGGDVAVEDAIFLSRLCKKVYVVHRRDEFRAAKRVVTKLMELENVEVLFDSTIERIIGNNIVEEVEVRNLTTTETRKIAIDGVFIAVGSTPLSSIYTDVVDTDAAGYIIADESCRTNAEGVFAAGDIRTKPLKQVITAASDGANAITAVERYLNTIKK